MLRRLECDQLSEGAHAWEQQPVGGNLGRLGRVLGDVAGGAANLAEVEPDDLELASPANALPVQVQLGASDRASDDALEQSARAQRRWLGQDVLAGAVEPDHGVVVDG